MELKFTELKFDENKTEQVGVRLTNLEWQRLRAIADYKEVTVSEVIRAIINHWYENRD